MYRRAIIQVILSPTKNQRIINKINGYTTLTGECIPMVSSFFSPLQTTSQLREPNGDIAPATFLRLKPRRLRKRAYRTTTGIPNATKHIQNKIRTTNQTIKTSKEFKLNKN